MTLLERLRAAVARLREEALSEQASDAEIEQGPRSDYVGEGEEVEEDDGLQLDQDP